MLKKGIYENIINQEIERDIHTAESQLWGTERNVY